MSHLMKFLLKKKQGTCELVPLHNFSQKTNKQEKKSPNPNHPEQQQQQRLICLSRSCLKRENFTFCCNSKILKVFPNVFVNDLSLKHLIYLIQPNKSSEEGSMTQMQIMASLVSLKQNRIFQLEETYKNHLVQLPDHFRADQKLKEIIKAVVQMLLKHYYF